MSWAFLELPTTVKLQLQGNSKNFKLKVPRRPIQYLQLFESRSMKNPNYLVRYWVRGTLFFYKAVRLGSMMGEVLEMPSYLRKIQDSPFYSVPSQVTLHHTTRTLPRKGTIYLLRIGSMISEMLDKSPGGQGCTL